MEARFPQIWHFFTPAIIPRIRAARLVCVVSFCVSTPPPRARSPAPGCAPDFHPLRHEKLLIMDTGTRIPVEDIAETDINLDSTGVYERLEDKVYADIKKLNVPPVSISDTMHNR